MSLKWLSLCAAFCVICHAATVDFSTMKVTKPVTVGTTLPSTCSVGQLFFLTATTPGLNLYGCASPNSWTVIGGPQGGAGGGSGTNTTSTPSRSATIAFASGSQNVLATEVGVQLQLTSDRDVTWTLAAGSAGTLTPTSPRSAIYVPPVSVSASAQNVVGGCMVFPEDSVYNTRIDKLPVNPSSGQWLAQSRAIADAGIGFSQSWSPNIVDNSLPAQASTFFYTGQLNGALFQFPTNLTRKRETGALTVEGSNDHHMVVLNRQTCQFQETYMDGLGSNGTTAQSGYLYQSTSYSQPTNGTTDAAGLPLLPLTLRLNDLESGQVNHALRFTGCNGCIANSHVWPAVYSTGTGSGVSPMGSRWRLRSSFDISSFSLKAQVILRGLQQYGMVLADIGQMNQINVDFDVSRDPSSLAALSELSQAKIFADQFEVVDESALMLSPASHAVNPNNGYESVSGYSLVQLTDGSGQSISIPIAVQPVLVGVPNTHLIVQASQNVQMQSWVNGADDQTVKWSVAAGPGSVTTQGLYTPPATVANPVAVKLTGTSNADPSATATVDLWIIPSGAIRIDVGSQTATTDHLGNTWLADTLGFEAGSTSNQDDSYPNWVWQGVLDAQIYETYNYTWGDDIIYGPFIVPNGTYAVNFLFGRGNCAGIYDPTQLYDNHLNSGPVMLQANNTSSQFDVSAAEADTCRQPAVGTIVVSVTDNELSVGVRSLSVNNTQSGVQLNGLSITMQ